jgi:hypothetical protein
MERPYKRLIQHPDFEVPVPSRVSVVGFLAVYVVAGLMLLGLIAFVTWIKGGM